MDLVLRTTGRVTQDLEAEVVRALEDADLAALNVAKGSEPKHLQRVSMRHHALARAVASGKPIYEAAMIAGYEPPRVSYLKNDPAFLESVAFYKSRVDESFTDMHERMAKLGEDVVAELHTRLEEEPEKFSVGHLTELTKTLADRTGHGPTTTSTNVNVSINLAARLEAARKRVAERPQIDVTPRKVEDGDPNT